MIFNDDELNDELKDKLSLLAPTPDRDPAKAAQGRVNFLSKVRETSSRFVAPPVEKRSNNGLLQGLFGKRFSLAPLTIALIIAVGLIFGGWGTVSAAQGSVPYDSLYPVKLATENIRLAFTADPEARIALLTTYTQNRIEEATTLVSRGEPIPDELPDAVEKQLDEIFMLAATMDEESMQAALEGVQRHLRPRDQDQGMTNAMNGLPEGQDPQLERLQNMVQERQQIAQTGLEEPGTFQQQFKHQGQGPRQTITPTLTATLTSTITGTVTITPEVTVTLTITPGHYGPGPCDTPGSCTPPAEEHGPYEHKGTPPGPDDHEGYGPGSEQGSGPQKPSATPVPEEIEEPQETPEPGNNNKSKEKDADSSNKGGKP